MQLSLLTKTQVVNLMVAEVQGYAAQNGVTINCSDGSIVLATINACALIYLWLQWLALSILSASRLSTSTGSDCDTFGNDFSFGRLQGAASSGPVVFSRFTPTLSAYVPVGTAIKTTDGSQSFSVLADATNAAWVAPNSTYPSGAYLLPAGTSSVTVTADNNAVGAAGNIIAGAIGLISTQITGVDTVTNPSAFTNGVNVETDLSYKTRFSLFLPALAKATPIAMESAALGVSQNITCAILNCVATIGGSPVLGSGVIAVDDGSGNTPAATLSAVADAAAGTSIAALGASISVVQATVVRANVEVTIICPTAALKAAAQSVVRGAISAYIGELPVATTPAVGAPANGVLAYNILAKIAFDASPSVVNISGLTLNGSSADIGGSPGTVVRAASVTVN
jgi:hypothetical protein